MTAPERAARADAADTTCSAAFARALGGRADDGLALVAVGGYGRRELAPYSDLDVVLVHTDRVAEDDVADVAATVWYPLWDAGLPLDHAVRSLAEVERAAERDLRVALGLLDARHVAGDPAITLQLRTEVLTRWRRDARSRIEGLHELVESRGRRHGELAHSAVPDLKDATGGLRDATALTALVATWLVDVPHTDLERGRGRLLDVRDALHGAAGRATDRVAPELWGDLAARLGLPGEEAAQRYVRTIGRRITHLSRLTWRRAEGMLARPTTTPMRRGPALDPLGHGLAVSGGEVVLDRRSRPRDRPTLLLRAAAEAAERDLILAPSTAARLARECPDLPAPWPREARDLLVRLLAAGPGLLPVWETLDETGALERLLPEWERVRLLPHASVVHRYTVDRHLVETCIEASRLIRRVSRPDVLLVAALLHDLGKGGPVDHSVAGAPLAAACAARLGFDPPEVSMIADLVRWHLLLPEVATTRDLEDPATVDHVAERIADGETAELLAVLTEADARATAAKAWSTWRSRLVLELAARLDARLAGEPRGGPTPEPAPVDLSDTRADRTRADVRLARTPDGSRVIVVAPDRVGVLAAVTATLAMLRVSIRAGRAWVEEDLSVSTWEVEEVHVDAAVVRQRLEAVLAGRVDADAHLRSGVPGSLEPSVAVHHEASAHATVLEVRMADHRGLVALVCRALGGLGLVVRSAHVSTFGPQAVDAFYVQEASAGALSDERAAEAAHAVRRVLAEPVTLDA